MRAEPAIVTGASGGIGLEFARLLAQAGYDLALVARSAQRLQTVAGELHERFGVRVEVHAMDLATSGAARDLFSRVPSCSVLVNNAGFANNGTFARIGLNDITEEVQLDVATLVQLTRLYLPAMLERGSGKILNVASTAAFLPGPNMAVYYAAKAFVLSFSQAVAHEVRSSGVTVTCLCPGATATGFQARAKMESSPLMRTVRADASGVARAGFNGMMAGKAVVIPGTLNAVAAFAAKFAPRPLLLDISARLTRTE